MPHLHKDRCMDCGGCVGECPHDAIDLDFGLITFLPSCVECNLCVQICPVDAIEPLAGSPAKKLPRAARWLALREAEASPASTRGDD